MKPESAFAKWLQQLQELCPLLDQVPDANRIHYSLYTKLRRQAEVLDPGDTAEEADPITLIRSFLDSVDFDAVDNWLVHLPSSAWRLGQARRLVELSLSEGTEQLRAVLIRYLSQPRYKGISNSEWHRLIEEFAETFDQIPGSDKKNLESVRYVRQQGQASGDTDFVICCNEEKSLDYDVVDRWLLRIPAAEWKMYEAARLMTEDPDSLRKEVNKWLLHPRYGNPVASSSAWAFPREGEGGAVQYKGKDISLQPHLSALLRVLWECDGRPVGMKALQNASPSGDAGARSVHASISKLNTLIRNALKLDRTYRPIQHAGKGAYCLHLR